MPSECARTMSARRSPTCYLRSFLPCCSLSLRLITPAAHNSGSEGRRIGLRIARIPLADGLFAAHELAVTVGKADIASGIFLGPDAAGFLELQFVPRGNRVRGA